MINNRELALLIWLGLALVGVFVLCLRRGDLRSSLLLVLRSLGQPVIAVPMLLLVAWVVGLVLVADRFAWWEPDLATDTSVWFFGTALVLMFNVTTALHEERFFRRTVINAVEVTVLVGAFINLYVFSLWVELILLPTLTVLVMLAAVAGTQPRFAGVKAFLETVLALIGFALIGYVVFQIVSDWEAFDRTGTLRRFVLPVWLTIGIVPFIYLLSLYVAYDSAFRQIDHQTDQRWQRWRTKLALVLCLRVGIQDIAAFRFYWAKQAATARSFRDATRVIRDFRASRREHQRVEAEAQDRLRQFAGVDGVDEDGRRLDQREFKETKDALRTLATAQMGWYRNRGGRYRPELVDILQSAFERSGLPSEHGITLWVAGDGQSWWAYRRTVTGWCFAVGAAAPPPDQWLHDGAEPPAGPPGEDPAWGERWGLDAKNW